MELAEWFEKSHAGVFLKFTILKTADRMFNKNISVIIGLNNFVCFVSIVFFSQILLGEGFFRCESPVN